MRKEEIFIHFHFPFIQFHYNVPLMVRLALSYEECEGFNSD